MMTILRAIVVHAGVDDLGQGGASDSLTTGNAGARFVLIMRRIIMIINIVSMMIVITRRIIMRMNIVFNDDVMENLEAV